MEGDRPESAEETGRICSICLLPKEEEKECQSCCHTGNRLTQFQQELADSSLIRVIEALKGVEESRYSDMGCPLLAPTTSSTLGIEGAKNVRITSRTVYCL